MEIYGRRLDGPNYCSIPFRLNHRTRPRMVPPPACLSNCLTVWIFVVCSALSFDFQSKLTFNLIRPLVEMLVLLLVAAALSKSATRFDNFQSTMWMLTTVFVYTFGATIISDLFTLLPCFRGSDGEMMLHDPGTPCYGHGTLMVLGPIGICMYTAAAAYVLGFAFLSHKSVIQFPARHELHEVEHTFKAFGFLFYGVTCLQSPCPSGGELTGVAVLLVVACAPTDFLIIVSNMLVQVRVCYLMARSITIGATVPENLLRVHSSTEYLLVDRVHFSSSLLHLCN